LSVYEKKKYVWKMLYIYMLGYDVDFGHMETVALISAPKYAEKQAHTLSQTFLQLLYGSLCLIVPFTFDFVDFQLCLLSTGLLCP